MQQLKVFPVQEMSPKIESSNTMKKEMNFLALPALPLTMAICSGRGFNIKYLDKIDWLESKNIFYWGDLDIQGFHILHQMKSYYPQTSSIVMNKGVFEKFRDDIRKGVPEA